MIEFSRRIGECARSETDNFGVNHNYNKILESDWLSTALISALIGQYASCISNWTVCTITRALKWLFFTASQKIGISFVLIKKKSLIHHNCIDIIQHFAFYNWRSVSCFSNS